MSSPFFCVGTQKSGTSTLHNILKQHSEITLPTPKETMFFKDQLLYEKGVEYYKETFFGGEIRTTCWGEICPEYMFSKNAAKWIFETFGHDTKIIFILRNPVDRAYSHFQMTQRRGIEKKDFLEALELEENRIYTSSDARNHFSYVTRGLYSDQVATFVDLFGMDNILFIKFEDEIVKNREKMLEKVLDFLDLPVEDLFLDIKSGSADLPKSEFIKNLTHKSSFAKKLWRGLFPGSLSKYRVAIVSKLNEWNKKPMPKKLSKEEKKNVYEKYFANDVEKLELLIKEDFSVWKDY